MVKDITPFLSPICDIPVAASQTIKMNDVLWLNASKLWEICPTTYVTGLVGIAMKDITTAAGETTMLLPVATVCDCYPTFDGTAEEGQAIGPSATTAGRVMAIAALDEPAAWAEATSQTELNKIMKKKGHAIEPGVNTAASRVFFNGLGGV